MENGMGDDTRLDGVRAAAVRCMAIANDCWDDMESSPGDIREGAVSGIARTIQELLDARDAEIRALRAALAGRELPAHATGLTTITTDRSQWNRLEAGQPIEVHFLDARRVPRVGETVFVRCVQMRPLRAIVMVADRLEAQLCRYPEPDRG